MSWELIQQLPSSCDARCHDSRYNMTVPATVRDAASWRVMSHRTCGMLNTVQYWNIMHSRAVMTAEVDHEWLRTERAAVAELWSLWWDLVSDWTVYTQHHHTHTHTLCFTNRPTAWRFCVSLETKQVILDTLFPAYLTPSNSQRKYSNADRVFCMFTYLHFAVLQLGCERSSTDWYMLWRDTDRGCSVATVQSRRPCQSSWLHTTGHDDWLDHRSHHQQQQQQQHSGIYRRHRRLADEDILPLIHQGAALAMDTPALQCHHKGMR